MYFIRLWETNSDDPIVIDQVTYDEKNDLLASLYEQDVFFFQDIYGDRYINTKNISHICIEKMEEIKINSEEIKEQKYQYQNGTGVARRRAERYLKSRGLL